MSVTKMVIKSGYVYKNRKGELVRMARHLDDGQQTAEGLEMIGLIDGGKDALFETFEAKRANVDIFSFDVFKTVWRVID